MFTGLSKNLKILSIWSVTTNVFYSLIFSLNCLLKRDYMPVSFMILSIGVIYPN